MLRPGGGKRARFKSRYCPWVLLRKRQFYSKRLAWEPLRAKLQGHMISEDVHVCPSVLSCTCAYADANSDRAGGSAMWPIINSRKFRVK